jgi:small subunit ribosomal protein S15
MVMTKDRRVELVQGYRTHEKDTGSPQVQVALLTDRIKYITEHLRTHRKDHTTRRGLLMLVGKRNRLLRFLSRKDRESYQKLIQSLGLRK